MRLLRAEPRLKVWVNERVSTLLTETPHFETVKLIQNDRRILFFK
jgi:hypothetical protein